MSNFKRITAVLLSMLMLLGLMPAMAEDNGTLVGDAILFAPPPGQYSAVEYTLKDGNGAVVANPILTLTGAPAGITVSGNQLILNGDTIKNGTFTITAAGGDVTASLPAEVKDRRLFFDMQGYEKGGTDVSAVGAGNATLLSTGDKDTSATIFADDTSTAGDHELKVASADGNGFIHATPVAKVKIRANSFGVKPENIKKFTMEMDITHDNTTTTSGSAHNIFHSGYALKYTIGMTGYGAKEIVANYGENGETALDGTTGKEFEKSNINLKEYADGWNKLRMEFDWTANTYSVYIDEAPVWIDYTIPARMSEMFDSNYDIFMCCRFDDVAFYTGTKSDAPPSTEPREGTIVGDTVLFAPQPGQCSEVEYVLKDGETEVEDAAFSLSTGAPEGVRIDGNKLIMDGNKIKNGAVVINAKSADGLVTATLTATVQDTRLFFDMNGDTNIGKPELLSGGNDDKTIFGSTVDSDSKGTQEYCGNDFIIADAADTIKLQPRVFGLDHTKVQKFTMEMKIKRHGKWMTDNTFNNILHGGWALKYWYGADGTFENYELANTGNESGTYFGTAETANYVQGNAKLGKDWQTLRIEFDWANNKYSIYLDDAVVYNNYTMPTRDGDIAMKKMFTDAADISMQCSFDDVAFYTGSAMENTYKLTGDEVITLTDNTTSINKTYNLVNKANSADVANAKYSVTGMTGVSIDETTGVLTINQANVDKVGVIFVSAYTDGFPAATYKVAINKEYILVGDAVYTTGALGTGEKKITAVYDLTSIDDFYEIYIAHYTKDNSGANQLVSASKANEYTGDFKEGDTAKVFVWQYGSLKPLKEIVEMK